MLLATCWATTCAAQIFERARPVNLIVKVFVGGFSEHAQAGVTVQLLDGFGTMEIEARTDGTGMVEFHTVTGLHRIRVFGPGIQEYNGSVELLRVEIRRVENVVVRADTSAAHTIASGTGSNAGIVAAARLKVPEKAQREFRKGSEALERKEWPEAKKRFEAAIALYPDYDVAYNGLGSALLASGNSERAREAFEKAIQVNDRFAEAYRNLARISLSEHKYEEVDTLLTKSLAADPLNTWALTYAAYSELLTRKFSEAIDHARKAHTVAHDGLASVHIVAARALEATQQPAEALAEYRLYLQEDPKGRDATRAREAVARLSNPVPK